MSSTHQPDFYSFCWLHLWIGNSKNIFTYQTRDGQLIKASCHSEIDNSNTIAWKSTKDWKYIGYFECKRI